jgi:anti-repressor protein
MCEYGFLENKDFESISEKSEKPQEGRPSTDHAISLDMAKEISMIQRTDKGKQARLYFIECERRLQSVTPATLSGDYLIRIGQEMNRLNQQLVIAEAKIDADKPKVLFSEAVATAKTDILIGEFAKILKQNGKDTGQNRLYQWLRENGDLCSKGELYNSPTQRAMDLGLFRVKETTRVHHDGHVSIDRTTKITGKGQIYFVNRFLGKEMLSAEVGGEFPKGYFEEIGCVS